GVDQAFLLRSVERGGRADVEALLDQVVDAGRCGPVGACDAQAIARLEHQEIGIGDADDRAERHHLAIETARDRKLFGGTHRAAVLARKLYLVPRAERCGVRDALRPTAAARNATAPGRLRSARAIRAAVE